MISHSLKGSLNFVRRACQRQSLWRFVVREKAHLRVLIYGRYTGAEFHGAPPCAAVSASPCITVIHPRDARAPYIPRGPPCVQHLLGTVRHGWEEQTAPDSCARCRGGAVQGNAGFMAGSSISCRGRGRSRAGKVIRPPRKSICALFLSVISRLPKKPTPLLDIRPDTHRRA